MITKKTLRHDYDAIFFDKQWLILQIHFEFRVLKNVKTQQHHVLKSNMFVQVYKNKTLYEF